MKEGLRSHGQLRGQEGIRTQGGVPVGLITPFLSPARVFKVSSLFRTLTSSSFSWLISSFSFSPWRKVVVSGLCLERHCGKGKAIPKRVRCSGAVTARERERAQLLGESGTHGEHLIVTSWLIRSHLRLNVSKT